MQPQILSLDEALELNPVGFFQLRILIMCGFAFMADALEVNLLVFLSTCAGDEWSLNDHEKASITGVVFGGILIGSLFWGVFADRYGRKLAYVWACTMISIGGFLSGVSPSYYWLIFFRALCGFGIGGINIPFDLLAEFLPSTHRGSFLNYIQYFWTIGSLTVTAIAWMSLESKGWRFLAYMTAIPVTITNIFSVFYLPESPRWLLMKGRIAEAEKVVRDAALVNNITMAPFTLLNDEKNEHEIKDASYWDLLRFKDVRNVTLPLWFVWFAFGFTYYGLILFVGRIYAESSDDDTESAAKCAFDYQSIFINATAEIIGVALPAYIVDKHGRVRTNQLFYFLAAITVVCMGIQMPVNGMLAVSLVSRMAIYAASNATWLITPELFSTEYRTVGHSSSLAWSKLGAFLSPYVVVSSLNYFQLGVILGCVNLAAVAAVQYLPETTGRCLEDFHRQVSTSFSSTHSHLDVFDTDAECYSNNSSMHGGFNSDGEVLNVGFNVHSTVHNTLLGSNTHHSSGSSGSVVRNKHSMHKNIVNGGGGAGDYQPVSNQDTVAAGDFSPHSINDNKSQYNPIVTVNDDNNHKRTNSSINSNRKAAMNVKDFRF